MRSTGTSCWTWPRSIGTRAAEWSSAPWAAGARPRATGKTLARHGGDTSFVAVAADAEPPRLVLDAGTGVHRLGEALGSAPFSGSILLTHLHWDHTHGLPLHPAVDRQDAAVDLFLPARGRDPVDLLARAMGPPDFPITPGQLGGTWRFNALEEGRQLIEGCGVVAFEALTREAAPLDTA